MDYSLEGSDVFQTRQGSDESTLASQRQDAALAQHTLLHEGIDGSRQLLPITSDLGGQGLRISCEGKSTAEEVQEHDIGRIGEGVHVGSEGHVVLEVKGANASQTVVLS